MIDNTVDDTQVNDKRKSTVGRDAEKCLSKFLSIVAARFDIRHSYDRRAMYIR